MSMQALLEAPNSSDSLTESLEQAILRHLNEQDVIGLDTLVVLLPGYSWNQIFQAVDRLARTSGITLRRHRSEYTLFSPHYAA